MPFVNNIVNSVTLNSVHYFVFKEEDIWIHENNINNKEFAYDFSFIYNPVKTNNSFLSEANIMTCASTSA